MSKAILYFEGVVTQSDLDVLGFWCWHEGCPDYGKKGSGNIILKERYGRNNIALLLCKTCGHCFSENRGTPFFDLNTSMEEVLRTIALLPEKGSIRGLARATGHDKNTICRWLDLVGNHCREVTDYYLNDLNMDRVQVDEIWSYIKKREGMCLARSICLPDHDFINESKRVMNLAKISNQYLLPMQPKMMPLRLVVHDIKKCIY